MNLPRLLRTLAPLRPEQVWGRLAHRLIRPRPNVAPAPPRRDLVGTWTRPIECRVSLTAENTVCFLNAPGEIARPEQWRDPERPLLWLYNLHYFDDLTAEDAPARSADHARLIDRWIHENPPGSAPGWDPYPTSLRIVNWIKWSLSGGYLSDDALASLAAQVRWLMGRLEHHLLGNHLLANAKALVFAGAYFRRPEAQAWLDAGVEILTRELAEQVLADGGHFERSPMYHAIILEDVLDLSNLSRAFGLADTGETEVLVETMRVWLQAMSHPDGRIAFFNDAAFEIAAEPAVIEAYAARLGFAPVAALAPGITDLEASGYVRLQAGEAVVVVDAAEIGPSYLPGHAHADSLSFEWSLGDERVVVNGGTSEYGLGAERQRQRSTAAHSTVVVDGENSSEVWSGFRVGRRARIVDRTVCEEGASLILKAAHDGYRFLRGRPRHAREWRLTPASLRVRDTVTPRPHSAVARYHLAPGCTPEVGAGGLDGAITTPKGRRITWRASSPVWMEPSQWAPAFGMVIQTVALVADVPPGGLTLDFAW